MSGSGLIRSIKLNTPLNSVDDVLDLGVAQLRVDRQRYYLSCQAARHTQRSRVGESSVAIHLVQRQLVVNPRFDAALSKVLAEQSAVHSSKLDHVFLHSVAVPVITME